MKEGLFELKPMKYDKFLSRPYRLRRLEENNPRKLIPEYSFRIHQSKKTFFCQRSESKVSLSLYMLL
jgi:hypothetical protein